MTIAVRLRRLYHTANALTGGRLGILKSALDSFTKERGSQGAASLSYYSLFSLFPLLLVLVSAGSYFFSGDPVERVLDLVTQVIPGSRALLARNLAQVLEERGAVGLVGLLTLLWSASGWLSVLVNNINRAWPEAQPRGFLKNRALAVGLVLVIFLLLIVSVIGPAAVDLVRPHLFPAESGGAGLWTLLANVAAWFVSVLLFAGLYRWLPNTRVDGTAAFWGALAAATAQRLATAGFAWYLNSGFSRYSLVYGSLGAVIALLLMAYIGSWIALFGAHLTAAIQHARPASP